jgi:hypothetical protein
MVDLVLLTGVHEGSSYEGYDSGNLADWMTEQGKLDNFRSWFNTNNIQGLNNVAEARGGFVVRKQDVDTYLAI